MKLTEVFKQLTYGELSQISLGGSTLGEINEDNYERILIHINLGLTALHTRFPLKEERFKVELQPDQFTYILSSAYAQSNTKSKEANKYINDSDTKFVDNLLKVERINTDGKFELALNDDSNEYSIKTPSFNTLRVPIALVNKTVGLPDKLKTDSLEVVYRANHPLIDSNAGGFNVDTYEIHLPYSHLEALLLYVASRVNNPIGMGQEFNAGNTYAMKYEAACAQLEVGNLKVDQGSQNTRLERNGWV